MAPLRRSEEEKSTLSLDFWKISPNLTGRPLPSLALARFLLGLPCTFLRIEELMETIKVAFRSWVSHMPFDSLLGSCSPASVGKGGESVYEAGRYE